MKRLKGILFLMTLGVNLFSQSAKIKGTVTDKKNGELITGAAIIVKGTTIGTTSDFDGNFELTISSVGEVTIECSFVSYEKIIKTIQLKQGDEHLLDFELLTADVALDEVQVIGKLNRENDNLLLIEQKNASVSIESIGANELSSKGASDAAAGVVKVTGITKQSGSYTINIRGLGDRYNSTTLNGLPLPSNHAEYKNINLELFSTDIIGAISVEKVFTSTLYGDVAGANINIISKKHIGNSFLEIGLGTGTNSNLNFSKEFYLQDGPGEFGFSNFEIPTGEYVPTDYNVFSNQWNPVKKALKPNMDLSIKGGHTYHLGGQKSIGFFIAASFDNKYTYTNLLENKVNANGFYRQNLNGAEYIYETETSGLININYSNGKSDIYYNNLTLNSSEQNLKELEGYYVDIVGNTDEESAFLRRSNFERNIIEVNQLLGEHNLENNMELNWGLAVNHIENNLPDRRHNIFLLNKETGVYTPSTNDNANHHRYWHNLIENEFAGSISLSKSMGPSLSEDLKNRTKITFGYSGKMKFREFSSTQYNHGINNDFSDLPINPYDVDSYFNNAQLNSGIFQIKTFYSNLNLPVIYGGNQLINAGFALLEYHVNLKLLLVLGLRYENVNQDVDFRTTIRSGEEGFTKNFVLPSLALKYKTTEKSNVRFGLSSTYTLPQFKEIAPFQFEGITYSTVGNPYIKPSVNYNSDLKWEFFPNTGELISAALFAKYIIDPINQFVMSSASNDFTYANTGDHAYATGTEIEIKKNIIETEKENYTQKVYGGLNITLMYTEQVLSNEKVITESSGKYISSFNVEKEVLQGSAPVISNANIGYIITWPEKERSINSTITYSYVSDRLYLLGYAGSIGNQVDKAISDVDFILKYKFSKLSVSFSAKNLLNPEIKRVQTNRDKDYTILSHKKGMDFKIGISYKF